MEIRGLVFKIADQRRRRTGNLGTSKSSSNATLWSVNNLGSDFVTIFFSPYSGGGEGGGGTKSSKELEGASSPLRLFRLSFSLCPSLSHSLTRCVAYDNISDGARRRRRKKKKINIFIKKRKKLAAKNNTKNGSPPPPTSLCCWFLRFCSADKQQQQLWQRKYL